MQQHNATLTSLSWWGAMTSAFAFSGVHMDANTETHRVVLFLSTLGPGFRKVRFRAAKSDPCGRSQDPKIVSV